MFIRLPRPVAGEVDEDAVAVVGGAHPQAVGGVGAHDVDQGHGGLHEDPVGERRVLRRRVQVPVEGVVPDQPGRRVVAREQLVDGIHHGVAVEAPDLPQAGAGAVHLAELALVAVEAAGEAAAGHQVGQLLGRRQQVVARAGGARGRVEDDGVERQHVLRVRGEKQVDSLSETSLTSGP
jgi:hypothetical protein